jgi:hypothetical protein
MFVLPGADQCHDAGVFGLTGVSMNGGVQFRRDTQRKRTEKGSGEQPGDQ